MPMMITAVNRGAPKESEVSLFTWTFEPDLSAAQ